MNTPWGPERLAELRQHLDNGLSYTRIAAAMGVSRSTIAGKLDRLGWRLVDPDGAAVRAKARERKKKARKRARLRREKLKADAARRAIGLGYSKTSPEYRNKLPPAPEMTKTELRALLAQAVLNTTGARACR